MNTFTKSQKQKNLFYDYCQFLIACFTNWTQTYFANHTKKWSHDQLNRFLRNEDISSSELWKSVKDDIEYDEDGYIVFDDVVLPKPYAKKIIDNGLLGELHYAEVDYYHGIGPWYGQYEWNIKKGFGGSTLLTAGCHALDALLFFMDGNVEEVTSYHTQSAGEVFQPYEYKTTSVSLLKFEGGQKIGKVTSCVDCLQPYYFHIHLVGSEGSLLDNKIYSAKLKGMDKSKWSNLETSLIDSGDVSDHPYEPQFQAFIDSIGKNEPMPLTDFDTAFETHRVVFAADQSAEAGGKTVKLSELSG